MTAPVTDGQLVEAVLCLLDESPRPNILFGAPAIATVLLDKLLGVPESTVQAAQVIRAIEPLVPTLFPDPRQPTTRELRRNGKIEQWIVFEMPSERDMRQSDAGRAVVLAEGTLRRAAEGGNAARRGSSPMSRSDRQDKSGGDETLEGVGHTIRPEGDGDRPEPEPAPPTRPSTRPPGPSDARADDLRTDRSGDIDITRESRGSGAAEEERVPSSDNRRSPTAVRPSFLRSLSLRSRSRPSSPNGPLERAAGDVPLPTTPVDAERPLEGQGKLPSRYSHRAGPSVDPPPIRRDDPPAVESVDGAVGAQTLTRPPPLLPLPPLRRATSNSPPTAPLLGSRLRLVPSSTGATIDPSPRSAVVKGEKERNRGFLRGLLSRKKEKSPAALGAVESKSRGEICTKVDGEAMRSALADTVLPMARDVIGSLSDTSGSSFEVVDPPEVPRDVLVSGERAVADRGRRRHDVRVEVEPLPLEATSIMTENLPPTKNDSGASEDDGGVAPPTVIGEIESRRLQPADTRGDTAEQKNVAATRHFRTAQWVRVGPQTTDQTRDMAGLPSTATGDDEADAKTESSARSYPSSPISPTSPVPTTYLGKTFEGLPLGPDVPAVRDISPVAVEPS